MSANTPSLKRHYYFAWLLRHRAGVLAGAAIVSAMGLIGAARVRVDVDVEQFIPNWGAARATYNAYKGAFSKEDTRFSAFWRSHSPPGVVLYGELEAIAHRFEAVGLEDIHWIGSMPVADQVVVDGESALGLRTLVERDSVSDAYVARMLERHGDDPLYRGYLWNGDQTVFGVHGFLPEAWNHDAKRQEVEAALTARLDSLGIAGSRMALSGVPVFRSRSPRLLQDDIGLFLGGGLIIGFGILWLALRRVRLVALSLVSTILAYICTLGVMGIMDKPITMLTSFIPIVVLVVGVSDSIHIIERYGRAIVDKVMGVDPIVTTFTDLTMPCFYTSLTTAIGFGSLAATRIGVIVDFGLFTALAIMLTYAISMTLLPVLISLAGRSPPRGSPPRFQRVVDVAARLARRPSPILAGSFILVGALGLVAGMGLRSNTYMVDDYRESSPLIQDMRWIEDAGFGLFQVNVFLQSEDDRMWHDPEALRWMDLLQRSLGADPIVTTAVGPPDVFRQLRAAVIDSSSTLLPARLDEASQLLLLAELEDEAFAEDLYRPADGTAQLVFTVRDVGSPEMLPWLARIDDYIEQNPPPFGTASVTGVVSLVHSFTARLLNSFGPSLILAGVLIFGVMAVMLRSVPFALLALLPNLFPILVLLGVMRVGNFDIKPSTILVISIAFGLAVDDTIHVLGRFRAAGNRGLGFADALEASVREAGPAMMLTTMLAAVGFALLMASQFEVLFLIGFLTIITAITALVADLFFLPLVLWAGAALKRRRVGVAALFIPLGLVLVGRPSAAEAQGSDDPSLSPEIRGRAIVEESQRRDQGWGDQTARLTMVLVDEDGREKIRQLLTMTLEGVGDGDKTIVVFDAPADLRGTALLTHAHHDGADDQWIYLPAFKRVKRIAASNQSASFMGSEFAYEDLGAQEVAAFDYRFLREELLDGVDCYVVERYPLDKDSGYRRQTMWFDRNGYRIQRIDFYDRDDVLLKTLEALMYRAYLDRYWRPDEMRMNNHQTGKRTILRWREIEFGTGLSDRDFESRALGRSP